MSPYLDSELDRTKTFEVSEHLGVCACCAKRFEQERRVEELLTERLGGVPALDWPAIERRAVRGRRRLIRWSIAASALAACLILGGVVYRGQGRPAPQRSSDWLLAEYASAAPDRAPFERAAIGDLDLASVTREVLGVALDIPLAAELSNGHSFKLVGFRRRTNDRGESYLELRINCCGKPVLMAVALQRNAAVLGELAENLEGEPDLRTIIRGDVRLAAATDGRIVVLAASHHPVDRLIRKVRTKAA